MYGVTGYGIATGFFFYSFFFFSNRRIDTCRSLAATEKGICVARKCGLAILSITTTFDDDTDFATNFAFISLDSYLLLLCSLFPRHRHSSGIWADTPAEGERF
jgi:hypothetical protein